MRNSLLAHGLIVFCLAPCSAPLVAAPEALEIGPETASRLPGGKEADGIIGDFLLRNDRVEAVVSGNLPLRRANMSTFYGTNGITPGCLYDLTLAGANNDQLTIFSPCSHQGKVSYVRLVKPGADGEAIIETVITAPNNQGVYRRHEYRLKSGWDGILVVTTLRNERNEPVKFSPDDRWTTFTRTGQFGDITWADAVDPADKAGYAYGRVEWNGLKARASELQLGAGEEVSFARFVAVGRSPAEAVGRVAGFRGGVGSAKARIIGPDGLAIPSASILFRKGDQSVSAYPDGNGIVSILLPAGEYNVETADPGRTTVTNQIKIEPGMLAEWETAMNAASAIALEIRGEEGRPLPCKVQFIGVEGTQSPDLGPPNRAHGCRDQYHSETGRFRVQIAPGNYRLIVTHGIEFSHLERAIRLAPGESQTVAGTLRRLVDTRGWVSADYHNHSTPSGDNTCGTDD